MKQMGQKIRTHTETTPLPAALTPWPRTSCWVCGSWGGGVAPLGTVQPWQPLTASLGPRHPQRAWAPGRSFGPTTGDPSRGRGHTEPSWPSWNWRFERTRIRTNVHCKKAKRAAIEWNQTLRDYYHFYSLSTKWLAPKCRVPLCYHARSVKLRGGSGPWLYKMSFYNIIVNRQPTLSQHIPYVHMLILVLHPLKTLGSNVLPTNQWKT